MQNTGYMYSAPLFARSEPEEGRVIPNYLGNLF